MRVIQVAPSRRPRPELWQGVVSCPGSGTCCGVILSYGISDIEMLVSPNIENATEELGVMRTSCCGRRICVTLPLFIREAYKLAGREVGAFRSDAVRLLSPSGPSDEDRPPFVR